MLYLIGWEQNVERIWETNKRSDIDMFAYLETTLGPIALGLWQSKKNKDPEQEIYQPHNSAFMNS